jgi:hypothetical protein
VLLLSLATFGTLSGAPPAPTGRSAFLAGGLTDEQVVVLAANHAASGHSAPLLLDSANIRPNLRAFLSKYRPDQVTPIGYFQGGQEELRRQLGGWIAPVVPWGPEVPEALWKVLFPKAETAIVCPPGPRRLLLQAACLAGTARAPLVVLHGQEKEEAALRQRLTTWGTRKVYAVGATADALRDLNGMNVVSLADEQAVSGCRLGLLKGPVDTLVVANPADFGKGRAGLSNLAPMLAARRRGALLLTSDKGSDASAVIKAALKEPALSRANNLLLVADFRAIPTERRPDPLRGSKDTIDVEVPGAAKDELFTFATGRLFHRDAAVVPLILAREHLLASATGPRVAVTVGDPDGALSLLETISRNTAKEFRNAGYLTRSLFLRESNPGSLRRLLPEADVFLWEGHASGLYGWGIARWPEPMRPSLVFLQSCGGLTEQNGLAFLERGAVGVIGSPARTFSATGGAIAMAYFDALLYDRQSVGGAMRQAKNFLLAYARLKEQRLGKGVKREGANVRSAWAYTLWGDPTLQLPRPEPPEDALPNIQTEVNGDRITIRLPFETYDKVTTRRYQAVVRPNGRLAGLLTKAEGDTKKTLVPLLFTEVHLSDGPAGKVPRLRSRVAADHWVFLWDARLRTGYLLVQPRVRDGDEIRFVVDWEE